MVIGMHCSENENVCSVKKENNLGYYRLHTIWKDDGFFINITSKDGAWRGEMTPRDISKMSAQLQMDPETYLSKCKEALTCHDGQPGMVYAVENGSFAWKKVLDEDSGMKMRMGSVMVEPTNFVDTVQNLVHAALNCNKKLQRELNELTKEKEIILKNKNDLLNKLNELIEIKNAMESDLYARFLLLLNGKKSKIETLEKTLEEEFRKSKWIKDKSRKDNPYEVDTEDGSSDLEAEAPKSSFRRKRKTDTSRAMTASKNSRLTAKEAPEEKKVPNPDDEEEPENVNYSKDLSPEPGTSKEVEKIGKREIPTTKDELLEYFYGDS